MSAVTLTCSLPLPGNFRAVEFLDFHRRDAAQFAERVEDQVLHKGMSWRGLPACLAIALQAGRAVVRLAIDGPLAPGDPVMLERTVRRMLGLDQPIDAFEAACRSHPQLGPLIARRPGLRVPCAATPFEALTWAVTGQQISVGAALSIRRRLIEAAGLRHSGGLACYPDARRLASMDEEVLRQAGFSRTKTQTLKALSQHVDRGLLPLDAWADAPPPEEIRARLLAFRGVGPWTVSYVLLRGFGWLDGSLHGDVAVRRKLQALLACPEAVTEVAARRWLMEFSPWRALVAAHLWLMDTPSGG